MGISLTSLSRGAGCGCKIGPAELDPILATLPRSVDPNLLVGCETVDDAGVYRVGDDLAIVQSIDFFTPIVDDPYDFGAIAAANALSDLYAMGATPLTAMNVVAFSLETLGPSVLQEILRGGHDTVAEAGAVIVGGHTIEDPEPKYGLAVTGLVRPAEVLTNAGAQPGDVLVLSKPVGAGVASTAAKRGISAPSLSDQATVVMRTLNRNASLAARRSQAHALTDVTGFGLLGHLHELARASGLSAELEADAVPAMAGVIELLTGDEAPLAGGTRRNRAHAETFTTFAAGVTRARRWLLCDAMTSGGLLAALPPDRAQQEPALGPVIGQLRAGEPGTIAVV